MTALDESGTTIYGLLVERVKEAIVALNPNGESYVKRDGIKEWIKRNHPDDFDEISRSWKIYLPKAARDPASGFRHKPGTYGYELTPEPSISNPLLGSEAQVVETAEANVRSERMERERALYPLLVDWMLSKDLKAKDTSNSRRGGKWGNPDITGLRIVEGYLGQRHLEVTTIEAKVSPANWKQEFFEAVSHKRFAHRVYFAVAWGSDEPSIEALDFADEMRQYGEKFQVGVLVVFVPTADYVALTGSKTLPKLDGDNLVVELWPAVLDSVAPALLTDYLHGTLGIESDAALYAFGSE